jgi:peroxiredoxin (alkyl hydroperoxide reductase subunit C)
MIADVTHQICHAYGVAHPEAHIAFRATFVIDNTGVIRAEMVNDLPIGRNIDELLRLVDAVQHHRKHGEVCPAGWHPGAPAMTATTAGVAAYLSAHADKL